ncbi:MAG: hypothetical protein OEY00_06975 [Gammaproteobacteria bacterium]|nr:hypothetical protein [Gammaproteobacteria bacterium]
MNNIIKFRIFLLFACACFVGCSNETTLAQQELVDRLIQEQIDIPYKEPNFEHAEYMLLKYGETAKQATERNKQLYTNIHNYLVALKNKPYEEKKAWVINHLELTMEHWESTIKSLDKPDEENKEIFLLHEQRKKWLAILKE